VSTKPAAWTAATNVVKRPSAMAVSTMSLGAGISVGGTAVAVGVAVDAPQAANTSDVNNTNNPNNEPVCRRFNLAPFHRVKHFALNQTIL
jgi:hypothetical protein